MLKSSIGPGMLYILVLVFYLYTMCYILYTFREFDSLLLLFENIIN